MKEIKQTCANVVRNANNERFGGRQNFFPDSWQQTFGKQSNVLLQGFGYKSYAGAGAGVHFKYDDNVSIADREHQKKNNIHTTFIGFCFSKQHLI